MDLGQQLYSMASTVAEFILSLSKDSVHGSGFMAATNSIGLKLGMPYFVQLVEIDLALVSMAYL